MFVYFQTGRLSNVSTFDLQTRLLSNSSIAILVDRKSTDSPTEKLVNNIYGLYWQNVAQTLVESVFLLKQHHQHIGSLWPQAVRVGVPYGPTPKAQHQQF